MADSIVFNLQSYKEVVGIANELAELETERAVRENLNVEIAPTKVLETIILEHGPAKIDRLKAEKKAREGK